MERVYNFLFNQLKINASEVIVAGISGGPDSMVLLHMLNELKNLKKIKIVCAHINHNLRSESSEEKLFIENYCNKNDIKFEYMKIEEYSEDNFHNQARVIRYNYFEEIVQKYNAKYLMTAHHGDDLIETILMRLVRGSTIKGYSGFSMVVNKENYQIIRPLIFVTKDQILDYTKQKKIEYRVDKSNEKEQYTRNRYRKHILPFLKKEDPNVNDKFLKFSETLALYNNYIDSVMMKQFVEVYNDNTLDINKFKELDYIIKTKVINYIFEKIYDDDLILISDVHTKLIMDLIDSQKPNARLYLPSNIQATKSYEKVKFHEEVVREDYKIELKAINNIPNGKNIEKINDIDTDDNYICRLNSNEIKLPLYIRNRRPGDKIKIKGMTGTKKVKDIFINEKIAYDDRNVWPILVDENDTILWIPGIKKSKLNQPKNKKCDIILKYY